MPASSAVNVTNRLNLLGETWYDFDVTGVITGNGSYAFGFASADTGTGLGCYSRETSYPPSLQITYIP